MVIQFLQLSKENALRFISKLKSTYLLSMKQEQNLLLLYFNPMLVQWIVTIKKKICPQGVVGWN